MCREVYLWCCIVSLVAVVAVVTGSPMMYKRNDQEKLEVELIPISSTVIPLYEFKVGAGVGTAAEPAKPLSEHALKRFLLKHHLSGEDPHELITAKREKTAARKKLITKDNA